MSDCGKSLAFVHLHQNITNEIQLYWFQNNSAIYSARWLEYKTGGRNLNITSIDDGNEHPLSNLNITYFEYKGLADEANENLRQNTIVSLIATFESYLAIVYIRAIYLSSEIIKDSNTQLMVKDIVDSVCGNNPRLSFAELVATKILWNKPLSEMLSKIFSVVKYGVNDASQKTIDELVVFSYLRNAIVHNNRCITVDLANKSDPRFVEVGKSVSTESRDVLRLSTLCLRVAKLIDNRFVATIINGKDSYLLAKELFVRYGLENGKIRDIVNGVLNTKINSDDLDVWISRWRRDDIVHNDFIFSDHIFSRIMKKYNI